MALKTGELSEVKTIRSHSLLVIGKSVSLPYITCTCARVL